jgi:regulation of enolase protein 1 (concanavalin A-like superfamily)
MDLREFMRRHQLKVLLIFVGIQIIILVAIQNYNHRPKAILDQVTMVEGRTTKITPLSNDTDKDEEDKISLMNVSQPIHGSVTKKLNLIFYNPAKGFSGVDSFTYTISDGRKESRNASIIVVVNKNHPPVAMHDIAQLYCGGTTYIDVLKNDQDSDGDSIYINGYTQPIHGNLNIIDGKLFYKSKSTSAITDSFHYVISDGINNSDSISVQIKVKSKSDPCYPWISNDIGDAAKIGSFTTVNNTFVIEASGSDIWNNSDGFHYAYQYITGDCEMQTKVESLVANNEWAKAGIMVRQSLSGSSKTAFVCISNKNGATYHQRVDNGESMDGGDRKQEIKTPYWVKIIRKGNNFKYCISEDGTKWETIGIADVSMSKDVYIGFAVTSHNNAEMAKAVFSNANTKIRRAE